MPFPLVLEKKASLFFSSLAVLSVAVIYYAEKRILLYFCMHLALRAALFFFQ